MKQVYVGYTYGCNCCTSDRASAVFETEEQAEAWEKEDYGNRCYWGPIDFFPKSEDE